MKKVSLPVGISDFEKIRENGYYYVDKSGLISELLRDGAAEVTLITRPRRFGKTLGMSMLASFFDISRNSRSLFEGLEISGERQICEEWMNQWPVIFVSLKDVDGLDFDGAFAMLRAMLAYVFQQYDFLLKSEEVHDFDKKLFSRILQKEASDDEVKTCFLLLTRMMCAHYKKPVILLIDEYDVPVARAGNRGYYAEMMDVVKAMLGTALKDNPFLRFAVVTGCLKITKESIFTGTNNFVSDTIASCGLNEYFGFTQSDVDRLLADAGAEKYAGSMKAWYDGYHFGDFDVYCPWDVMNYLLDLQRNPAARPAGYWKNTSDNAVIRSFIDFAGSSITKKLEILLAGGYIVQRVDEDLTYDYLHSSEENLWSVLYLTGYLTRAGQDVLIDLPNPLPDGMAALMIPNAEIREIFETTVIKWFDDSARTWNRRALFDAVWNGDSETASQEMNRLLRRTISYHDYKEDFYHAFLAGIFTGAGYVVESNKEHGEGRSDVVVCDPLESRVAVFEVKYSKTLEAMAADCDKALCQIHEKMYAEEYKDDYDQILCYGIAFFKKRCLLKIL
ncbi:MAG: AAA family ATPase [Lachnospiraceae bacterium]